MEITKVPSSLNDKLAEKTIFEALNKLNLESRLQLILRRIFSLFALNGIGIEMKANDKSKIDFCFPIYRAEGFFRVFKGEGAKLFLENKEWQRIYKFIQRVKLSKEHKKTNELWFEFDSPENEESQIVISGIYIQIECEVKSFNLKMYSKLLSLLATDIISPKLKSKLKELFQAVGKETKISYLGSFVGREFRALRVVLNIEYVNLLSFINLFRCESELFEIIIKLQMHCADHVAVHIDVTEKSIALQGIEIQPYNKAAITPLLTDLYHNNWCSKSDLELVSHFPSGIKLEDVNDPELKNKCEFNFCSCALYHVKLLNSPNRIAKFYLGVILTKR